MVDHDDELKSRPNKRAPEKISNVLHGVHTNPEAQNHKCACKNVPCLYVGTAIGITIQNVKPTLFNIHQAGTMTIVEVNFVIVLLPSRAYLCGQL
jgi:hypothetical protein